MADSAEVVRARELPLGAILVADVDNKQNIERIRKSGESASFGEQTGKNLENMVDKNQTRGLRL